MSPDSHRTVVLIPGDGIGPEITDAVVRILEAAKAPLSFVRAEAGAACAKRTGNPLPAETIELLKTHRLGLKGPCETPVGGGFRSVNVTLRQTFDLYANIRPAKSIPGIASRFDHIDMVIFRENTQGLYIGSEAWLDSEHTRAKAESLVTREASERVIRAAFEYARKNKRKKVTLVHKANILKLTTGLFLDVGRATAEDYPDVLFEDKIVDNMAMQMVLKPHQIDVLVTTNLFGDILSDLASGLVGGLGLTGSANLGTDCAIFEAVHGSAPDIAGKGIANPTGLLFSAVMLLEHIGEMDCAARVKKAVIDALRDGDHATPDVGGKGTTASFTDAVCANLKQP